MNPAYSHNRYSLKRQAIALTGKVRIYDPSKRLVLFSEQRMFKLKEDIRVYADESKSAEVLTIRARSVIDFSAAYDVIDVAAGEKVGVLRRKGLRSMLRDEWELLDPRDALIGVLTEDSLQLALLRRLLSSLIPQNYDVLIGGRRAADLKQRFNPFRYEMDLDFSMDISGGLDRRLGLAAGILLAVVEGRQE
ncbi:MAG TPA: hypothetical protein VMN57_04000 [Anaerolineales bacterium]|nr:hypothetical protein [Anaerolineales bacterium]